MSPVQLKVGQEFQGFFFPLGETVTKVASAIVNVTARCVHKRKIKS